MRVRLLNYALAATATLCVSLGCAFWWSAEENERLTRSNLIAEIALEAAQDEAKLLREKLEYAGNEVRLAEARQTSAESSERTAREKLSQETKARQAAEVARAQAHAALNASLAKVMHEEEARHSVESRFEAANQKLEEVQKGRRAAEEQLANTEAELKTVNSKLAEEEKARQAAERAHKAAEDAVTLITAKMTEEIFAAAEAKAIAEASIMGAGAPASRMCHAKPMMRNAAATVGSHEPLGALAPIPSVAEAGKPRLTGADAVESPGAKEHRVSRDREAWNPVLAIQRAVFAWPRSPRNQARARWQSGP